MKKSNYAEITLDGAVIMVAVGFLLYTYMSTGDARPSDYELTAKLVYAEGLAVGSDVRIAGLQVGSISSLGLNRYLAAVHISIRDDIPVPKDSLLSELLVCLVPIHRW